MIGRVVTWNPTYKRGVIYGLRGGKYHVISWYLPKDLRPPRIGALLCFDPGDPEKYPLYRLRDGQRTGAVNIRRATWRDALRWIVMGK